MNKQYLDVLKMSIKNNILIPTIYNAIRRRCNICYVRNSQIKELHFEDVAFNKLKNKYKYVLDEAPTEYELSGDNAKIIWVCWLQGIENAPLLVKRCYESLIKNMPEFEIRVINEDNMLDYVDIPDYIIEKWKKGIISNAHFSDILRVALLVKHGGVWIDATVLCTNNDLTKYIVNSPIFVFKSVMRGSDTISASSWLISSKPNNPILILMQRLLNEYWKKENIIINYYMIHLFFTMAIEKYPEIWNELPTFNNVNPHILVNEMNNKFCEDRYEEINKISSFHKLNYKLDYNEEPDTFYTNIIINGNF